MDKETFYLLNKDERIKIDLIIVYHKHKDKNSTKTQFTVFILVPSTSITCPVSPIPSTLLISTRTN